jgi:hypothetical protein
MRKETFANAEGEERTREKKEGRRARGGKSESVREKERQMKHQEHGISQRIGKEQARSLPFWELKDWTGCSI